MDQNILQVVKKFNEVIRDTINGPNCLDRDICLGECCFVQLPLPKCLASYYIQRGWADASFFKRGSEFAFVMSVDLQSLRCKFFDFSLNGCSLHVSGFKAPHCWVYPTGLDGDEINHSCKKASGWDVTNLERLKEAKTILGEYVTLCKEEAIKENSEDQILVRLNTGSFVTLPKVSPYQMAGVQDSWDQFHILKDEGYSMGMKYFCDELHCSHSYFQCEQVCEEAYVQFRRYFEQNLPKYIEEYGFKQEYSILDIKKVVNRT